MHYINAICMQVDAEKMSKSKGNFLMMDECVKRFSADATRCVLHCYDAPISVSLSNSPMYDRIA
jgi:leucyl-tRNA synthetase